MKFPLILLLVPFLFTVSDHILARANGDPLAEKSLAQASTEKTEKDLIPLSEIEFRVPDTSFAKARLFPEEV